MATGGTVTLDTTGELIFDGGDDAGRADGCTTFTVTADSANAGNVLVRVVGMHVAGEEFPIAAGETHSFRFGNNAIRQVHAKASATTQVARYGIVAMNT